MLLDTPSNQRDCPIRVCPMRESVNQRVCPISVSNQSVQRLRLSETSQIETTQMLGWSSCRCANICADPGSFQNDLKLLPGRKQVETCVPLSADGAAGMVRFYLCPPWDTLRMLPGDLLTESRVNSSWQKQTRAFLSLEMVLLADNVHGWLTPPCGGISRVLEPARVSSGLGSVLEPQKRNMPDWSLWSGRFH